MEKPSENQQNQLKKVDSHVKLEKLFSKKQIKTKGNENNVNSK